MHIIIFDYMKKISLNISCYSHWKHDDAMTNWIFLCSLLVTLTHINKFRKGNLPAYLRDKTLVLAYIKLPRPAYHWRQNFGLGSATEEYLPLTQYREKWHCGHLLVKIVWVKHKYGIVWTKCACFVWPWPGLEAIIPKDGRYHVGRCKWQRDTISWE